MQNPLSCMIRRTVQEKWSQTGGLADTLIRFHQKIAPPTFLIIVRTASLYGRSSLGF